MKHHPLVRHRTTASKAKQTKSGAPADVAVGIGTRVVQVGVEQPSIGAIVPVATADQAAQYGLSPIDAALLFQRSDVTAYHSADLVIKP